jgi:hypothetical protein
MARKAKKITNGNRIAEALSIGLLGRAYPRRRVREILREAGRESVRRRDLPMEAVVYYVIALGLFMETSYGEVLRCLIEGLSWLEGQEPARAAGKSGITFARQRLGAGPLESLYNQCRPQATAATPGAFYQGLRLVSVDGSTLALADTAANRASFGKPKASRGETAFPTLRFAALVETGTHLMFAAAMDRYSTGESTVAERLLPRIERGMLVLVDRLYGSYSFFHKLAATGAHILARTRSNVILPVETMLPDGSYLSHLYASTKARRNKLEGLAVRVVEYRVKPPGETFRLLTTLLDPNLAPAAQLAALYPQRWEHEGVYAELKTHLRGGAHVVLRSKTAELVRQEFFGLMLAHHAVRSLMLEASQHDALDPDQLSFTHSVNVVRRKLAHPPVFSPSAARPPSPEHAP